MTKRKDKGCSITNVLQVYCCWAYLLITCILSSCKLSISLSWHMAVCMVLWHLLLLSCWTRMFILSVVSWLPQLLSSSLSPTSVW